MSNQMKRLPRQVPESLGWEWIVESWVPEEAARGGFDADPFGEALTPYLAAECEQARA